MSVNWILNDETTCGDHLAVSTKFGLGDDGRCWMLTFYDLSGYDDFDNDEWHISIRLESVRPGEEMKFVQWTANSKETDYPSFIQAYEAAEKLFEQALADPETWHVVIAPYLVEKVL